MSQISLTKVPDDLHAVMKSTYTKLIDFVMSPNFKMVVDELYALDPIDRPEFVRTRILDMHALSARGVKIPPGILIQRSSFGDGRPTLFVVKTYLPSGYDVAWENLNITFDQDTENDDIPRDKSAWKQPLPYQVQSALLAIGLKREDL